MTTDTPNLHLLRSPHMTSYSALTGDLEVVVIPEFLPRQSRVDQSMFDWAYHVTLTNHGDRPIQLMRRHWIITDGNTHVEHVEGEGVIGLQPVLEGGKSFTYSSGCPLRTPTGNMRGWYHFIDCATRVKFKCRIPLFFLRAPSSLH